MLLVWCVRYVSFKFNYWPILINSHRKTKVWIWYQHHECTKKVTWTIIDLVLGLGLGCVLFNPKSKYIIRLLMRNFRMRVSGNQKRSRSRLLFFPLNESLSGSSTEFIYIFFYHRTIFGLIMYIHIYICMFNFKVFFLIGVIGVRSCVVMLIRETDLLNYYYYYYFLNFCCPLRAQYWVES